MTLPSSFARPGNVAALVALMKAGARAQRPSALPPEWVEPRGVYLARHTLRGRIVLYAVDSTGDVVKWVTLRHHDPQELTTSYLWRVLDMIDPPRKALELV